MLVAALAFAQLPTAPKTWYGPATVTFPVQFGGNPYDPAQNDVRVRFVGPSGPPIERIAYFDEEASSWKAVLMAEAPGKYHATLVRNGVVKMETPKEGVVDIVDPVKRGYIRRDPIILNRLRFDSGETYFPLGFNLGWQDGAILPITDQIAKMSKSGINWTRIWACHWDGKNPWWPDKDARADLKQLWDPALQKWAKIVEAADTSGVPFQMVLFHHGAFSSTVNPNWPDHPWNAKNGGFLKDAADFFTDSEAKRRAKLWLRYAVARFGHSPSILAWELFNEVEWVDARYANRWPDIEAWQQEMARYLREIDPYHHLITTSSAVDRPALWEAMDYVQPHTYPANITAAIVAAGRPYAKPSFFGEFGPGGPVAGGNGRAILDGALAGIFANDAGAGQYWYWDAVEKENLYSKFAVVRAVIDASDVAKHPTAKPIELRVDTAERTAAVLAPGGGWEAATKTDFSLPEDLTPTKVRGLSAYIQGQAGGNREMFKGPLNVRFQAPTAGSVKIRLSQASKMGGEAVVSLDGREVYRKAWPAATSETNLAEVITVPFGVGTHTVTLLNPAADWIKLDDLTVTGIAPAATSIALADTEWVMVRLTAAPGATSKTATLIGLPLPDGAVAAKVVDLSNGERSSVSVTVKGSKAEVPLKADAVYVFRVR